LATKSNQIKQLIRNGRSASLQRTFKKSFTSFSHSTRNKTRDGLIRVRNIRALNGRFNTSITQDRKSGSAGMPRPISYAVFCLKKKTDGVVVEHTIAAGAYAVVFTRTAHSQTLLASGAHW